RRMRSASRSTPAECQVPGSMEAPLSRLGLLPGGLRVVQGFVFGGWDEPELAVEPSVVVPVDVLGDGQLEVVDAVPGPLVPYEFGFEQRVEGLGHRIVVGVADGPDRGDGVD